MLDRNYIKPIPKKIIAAIKREDKKRYKAPCGISRFYSYLSTWRKDAEPIGLQLLGNDVLQNTAHVDLQFTIQNCKLDILHASSTQQTGITHK